MPAYPPVAAVSDRRRRSEIDATIYVSLYRFGNSSVVSISHQEVPAKKVILTPENTCPPAAIYLKPAYSHLLSPPPRESALPTAH